MISGALLAVCWGYAPFCSGSQNLAQLHTVESHLFPCLRRHRVGPWVISWSLLPVDSWTAKVSHEILEEPDLCTSSTNLIRYRSHGKERKDNKSNRILNLSSIFKDIAIGEKSSVFYSSTKHVNEYSHKCLYVFFHAALPKLNHKATILLQYVWELSRLNLYRGTVADYFFLKQIVYIWLHPFPHSYCKTCLK